MGDLAIGIDLGTTYCCVAVYRDGNVEIIPNSVGTNTTPSYVHIDEDDFVTAGTAAKGLAPQDPTRAVYDVKRLIGRRFKDPRVQKDMEIWPFQVIEDVDTEYPRILLNEASYVPEQISSSLLEYLKKCAEEWLNCPVKRAVITVPAYFSKEQRHATKIAGSMAGLEVLKLLHEPTAAAVTYFYKQKSFKREKTVLVFDLGGGTFDVVVMNIKDGNILIKAIGGDSHLGGQDIDRNLVEHCLQEFQAKNGIDLTSVGPGRDKVKVTRLLRRLKSECEEIKTQLSQSKKSVISLDSVHGDISLVVKITREEFENLNDPLFQQCVNTVKAVVRDAKLTSADIDEVIMVGGSSRIPRVQELVMGLFKDKMPNRAINADEAVACGAAIQAALMTMDCPALRKIFPDINIRDVLSPASGAKPRSTELTNTPPTKSVRNQEVKSPSLGLGAKLRKYMSKSKSKQSEEAPEPNSSKTNQVNKPDEISTNFQMIANGLGGKDVKEIYRAWIRFSNLTKENPGTCKRFLEQRGIKVFLNCLDAFPNDLILKEYGMLSLINVAEVEHLRSQLMTSELISVFYNLLNSTECGHWVSYCAAKFLILILSDGVAAWTITSPKRAAVLSGIRRSVKRWEDQSAYFDCGSSLGPLLRLLNVTHTTECQLFAAWSLKNLTFLRHYYAYVSTLVKEGGLDMLKRFWCEDEDVREYVNLTLNQSMNILREEEKKTR